MLARDRLVPNHDSLAYDVEQAAQTVGVTFGRFDVLTNSRSEVLNFNLRPIRNGNEPKKYQRTSGSYFNRGRKVHAVCWHGHRDFMRALFARRPSLTLKTSFITYRGADDFEANHAETEYKEVGPMISPVTFGELCECGGY